MHHTEAKDILRTIGGLNDDDIKKLSKTDVQNHVSMLETAVRVHTELDSPSILTRNLLQRGKETLIKLKNAL